MKIKRKIEITTETEDVLIVRGRGQIINAPCDLCGGQTEMVPAEQVAIRTGRSLLDICRQAEEGKLHCKETKVLLICLNSLTDVESPGR